MLVRQYLEVPWLDFHGAESYSLEMQHPWIRHYARWLTRHPIAIVTTAIALAVLSVIGSSLFLKTKTGILDLYSEDNPTAQRFLHYTKEFGAAETLIVVFEGGTEQEKHQAIETLATRLRQDPQHSIEDIIYKINLNLFKEHAFQFMSETQAEKLLQQVKSPDGGIRALFEAHHLSDFFTFLNKKLQEGIKKGGSISAQSAKDLEKLIAPLKLFREFLDGQDLSGEAMANRLETSQEQSAVLDDEGYLRTDDRKMYIMMLRPVDRRQDYKSAQSLVKWTREQIEAVKSNFPNLTIGLTGGPALNSDQFSISKKDMTLASIFAYFSTGVIFILAFRSFARPLLGLLTLSIALCCVFGLVTLTIGHLNLFSMAFIVILVGQGTYYGVHVVARYEEELLKGRMVLEAIEETVTHIFGNITTSTITTSAAFFATLIVPLEGFTELGWIAGAGIMISSLAMQSVLPAFLLLWDRRRPREALLNPPRRNLPAALSQRSLEAIRKVFLNRAGWIVAILIGVGLWGAYRFYSPKYGVAFDNNLLNLQAKDTEAVRYEKKLINTSLSPRAGIFMTKDLTTAGQWVEQLRGLSTIQRVEWLGNIFPEGSLPTNLRAELRAGILNLPQARLQPPEPLQLENSLRQLKTTLEKLQDLALSASQGEKVIEESEAGITTIDALLAKLSGTVSSDASAQQMLWQKFLLPQIEEFQNRFFSAMRQTLINAAKEPPMALAEVPKELRDRFISADKTYAIYAYPKVNIWERKSLEEFVHQLMQVSKEVTGPPVMFYEILSQVRSSYFKAAGFSALAIFLIFLVDFRSWRFSLLAFSPLVLGVFTLFGLMSSFGLTFNTANMIALPMILGIGADNGVHILHRFREEGETNINFLFKSTGKALLITYLDSTTSFIGLAFANHQGLAGLGKVIILGLTCCTIVGILFLPAVMVFMIRLKKKF